MKRMERAFATVMAVHMLEHNTNEDRVTGNRRSTKKSGIVVDTARVGSATLRDVKTGVEFNVSTAGDVLQRWGGWPKSIGKRVAYQYQVCGSMNGVPRFPVCKFQELIGE